MYCVVDIQLLRLEVHFLFHCDSDVRPAASATSAKCTSGKLKGTRSIWSEHGGTPGCRHTNDLAVKLSESLEVSH